MTAAPDIDPVAIERLIQGRANADTLTRTEKRHGAHHIATLLDVAERTIVRWRKSEPALPPRPEQAATWRDHAACRSAGAAPFFPDEDGAHSYSRARSVCAGCTVRDACLDDVMAREGDADHADRAGLWGGLSPNQRAALALIRRGAVA